MTSSGLVVVPQYRHVKVITWSTSSTSGIKSDYLMRALAQETGGRAFFPIDIRELAPMYAVIAEELASQYTLGCISKNPRLDGAYRRIVVRLPSQAGARSRSRLGYLAPRMSTAAGRLK